MSTSLSGDAFSTATNVLGLVPILVTALVFIRRFNPTALFAKTEDLLLETKALFRSIQENIRLSDPVSEDFRSRIESAQTDILEYTSLIHFRQPFAWSYICVLNGTPLRIMRTARCIQNLRRDIACASFAGYIRTYGVDDDKWATSRARWRKNLSNDHTIDHLFPHPRPLHAIAQEAADFIGTDVQNVLYGPCDWENLIQHDGLRAVLHFEASVLRTLCWEFKIRLGTWDAVDNSTKSRLIRADNEREFLKCCEQTSSPGNKRVFVEPATLEGASENMRKVNPSTRGPKKASTDHQSLMLANPHIQWPRRAKELNKFPSFPAFGYRFSVRPDFSWISRYPLEPPFRNLPVRSAHRIEYLGWLRDTTAVMVYRGSVINRWCATVLLLAELQWLSNCACCLDGCHVPHDRLIFNIET